MLEEVLPPLSEKQRDLVAILELIRIENYAVKLNSYTFGRPKKDRVAIAQAFVAKAVYNFPTTLMLIEQLNCNEALRRICGWEYRRQIPSESTFSRAFNEFAQSDLLAKVHAELIRIQLQDRVVGHISRDSTAIEANEKPAPLKKKSLRKPRKSVVPDKAKSVLLPSQIELNIS